MTVTELFDQHVSQVLSSGTSFGQIKYLALGSGTGQAASDIDVANYITDSIIALSGTGSPTAGTGASDNDVIYSSYWAAGEGTGSITEAAVFRISGTTRNTMMLYTDAISVQKGASDTLKIDWTLTAGSS